MPACRPMRADARRNRERILDAARAVFAASGGEAQMDQIAARAGVGVGTVYRHFPTKDALLAEMVEQRFATFARWAREAAQEPDPWKAFAGHITRCLETTENDLGTQHAMRAAHGAFVAQEAAERTGLAAATEALIVRAQAAGAMRADFSIADVPIVMCGLSSGMTVHHWDWRRFLAIVLDGLRAPCGGADGAKKARC
jgi:AcrR family transcriptional regulator